MPHFSNIRNLFHIFLKIQDKDLLLAIFQLLSDNLHLLPIYLFYRFPLLLHLLSAGGGELDEPETGHQDKEQDGLRLGGLHFPLEGMQEPELCHLAGKETMMFTNGEGSFELRFRGSPSRRKYQLLIREFLALRQEKTAE